MSSVTVFDHHYLQYDRWFDENEKIFQAEVAAIRALLSDGGKGLEVGVGTGRFASELGIACGIEPSRNMARIAYERGISVCQAIGERLPFRNATFDYSALITVLCFVIEQRLLIAECRRVLKPGGRLLVGMIDRDSELGKMYECQKATNIFYRAASFRTIEETVAGIQRAGFELLSCTQTILGLPYETQGWDEVKPDFGEGAFVAVLSRSLDA